jgi:membrane fusion protein, copper/silver efflux system
MRRIVILTAVLGLALAGGSILLLTRNGSDAAANPSAKAAARYHCPMHPTYTSDKPGDCPICGMKLVPIDAPAGAEPKAGSGERKVAFYRSPMDPSIHSEKPAKDDMGMDFVPVYEDELQGSSSGVAGRAAVTISSERRQVLGVRSEPVRKMQLDHRIRTVGRVAVDERRLRHVHTKFDGYVEHLYVDYTGKLVRRGERLLSIYSPELVATQEEYLLAHRAQASLATSAVRTAAQGSIDLHEAARRRLLLWDIRPADIDRLEKAGQVTRTLDVYADIGGYVVEKMAFQGMRVTPADSLYEIADLSHLWVLADIYEYNLRSLALGTEGHINVASGGDKAWKGTVTYISPTVEEKTRTVKVRLEVENPDGELKPDMYADVFLHVNLGEGLVVPDGAVINAGDRRLVFLDRGEGRFEPREVRLGIKVAGGGVQVVSGVSEGDQVVTAANFLLDSESSLRAALSGMSSAGQPEKAPAPAGSGQSQHQH